MPSVWNRAKAATSKKKKPKPKPKPKIRSVRSAGGAATRTGAAITVTAASERVKQNKRNQAARKKVYVDSQGNIHGVPLPKRRPARKGAVGGGLGQVGKEAKKGRNTALSALRTTGKRLEQTGRALPGAVGTGPARGTSSRSGTGGGTSGGAARVGRPSGSTPAARQRSQANTAAGRKAGAATAAAQKVDDPINKLFDAARRSHAEELKRQQAIKAQRAAETAKFEDYMRQARESASTTLAEQFKASAADAQAARTAADQRVNRIIEQARGLVTNPGAREESGLNAGEQAFGFRQSADGYRSAANAFNQASLAQRNVDREKEDIARAQELRADIDNRYQSFLTEMARRSSEMDTEEIKARIQQANADRQYEIDKQAAEFLQSYRQGQLQVAQTDAETRRLSAINRANYQNASLQLKRQVEQGRLSLREAELQLKQRVAKANLTQKEKDRLTRIGIARIRSAGSANDNPAKDSVQTVRDYLTSQLEYYGGDWGSIDNHQRSETIRGAITALSTQNPRMKATQAMAVLASVFGGAPMNSNPQYKQMILQYFN